MQDPPSWREFLGDIIQNPQERQCMAKELGVAPITLTRWGHNEATPRPQNSRHLPDALPQHRTMLRELISKEMADFSTTSGGAVTKDTSQGVPYEFYERVLRTRAILPKGLRFSSLADLILQQALAQLDPYRLGLASIVARCMPPTPEYKIRSLRESVGRGTPPWGEELLQLHPPREE